MVRLSPWLSLRRNGHASQYRPGTCDGAVYTISRRSCKIKLSFSAPRLNVVQAIAGVRSVSKLLQSLKPQAHKLTSLTTTLPHQISTPRASLPCRSTDASTFSLTTRLPPSRARSRSWPTRITRPSSRRIPSGLCRSPGRSSQPCVLHVPAVW